MALNTSKCNCFTPLHFKGLKPGYPTGIVMGNYGYSISVQQLLCGHGCSFDALLI